MIYAHKTNEIPERVQGLKSIVKIQLTMRWRESTRMSLNIQFV